MTAITGTWQAVGADDVLQDGHHELAASLDQAATQDDDLRVHQMAHGQAGVAQRLGGAMQDAGHHGVFSLQRLADSAAADDAQIAAGKLGQFAGAASL